MSSRTAEKQRLRAVRHERERLAQSAARKRRLLRQGGLAVAVVAAVGAATAVALIPSKAKHPSRPALAASSSPFGQHYAGLDARRKAAGVPTMMNTMGSQAHFHPTLALFVNGRRVPVPANIGIDPTKDPMQMADLHTHDASGTIHVEGMPTATLGQLFKVWGVPLSRDRLGPYRATRATPVRMWVDRKPSRAFGGLNLADGQRIVISYGQKPPGLR